MEAYLIPIKTAIMIFPILAVLITVPYMTVQYRKYGSIPILRSVITYSFVLYLLCMYFLVILPLPSVSEVEKYTGPSTQLIPFQFIRDCIRETSLVISQPSTWLPALKQGCVLQPGFNILLFIPFGIYLRYYFRCGWKKVLLISFSLSLFFELTQLSGLYGIYPRSYRLFDVDDLMLNTGGGILGCLIAPILGKILPSRERLDQEAYQKGMAVSFCRRVLAFLIDWAVMGAFAVITICLFPILVIIIYPIFIVEGIFYFIMVPYLTKGYTIGKWILRIRIVSHNGEMPELYQYVLRNGLLYLGMIVIPEIWICYCLFLLLSREYRNRSLIHEQVSQTKCISTIGIKNKRYFKGTQEFFYPYKNNLI